MSLWNDIRLMRLSAEVKWTAASLRMFADDQGRGSADLDLLKGQVWTLDPSVSELDLIDHLWSLKKVGYIVLYSDSEEDYYAMSEWPSPSHPQPSTLPPPPVQPTASSSPADRSARERGSGSESASGWVSGPESPASEPLEGFPPDPFCPVHPNGIFAPCQDCGTARLYAKKWDRDRRLAAAAEAEGAQYR